MGNAESVPEPTADDKKYLDEAIKEARKGMFEGGIPVGAVLVVDGKVVGRGNNRRVQHGSPILHAEMMCLESAGRLPLGDYKRATLYTTLSPCAMCAGAVLHYQIPRVVIADSEHFQGEEMLLMTRGVEVMSLDFPDAKVLVKEFIELHPDLWAEDSGTEVGASSTLAPITAPQRLAPPEPQAALPAPAPAPRAPAVPSLRPAPSPAPSVVAADEPTETGSYAAPPGSFVPPPGSYVSYNAPSESGEPPENASYVPPPSSYTSYNPPAGSAAADSEFAPPSAPPSMYEGETASQAGDRAPSQAE